MTPFQGYLAAVLVFATGVALSVFGWVAHQTEAVQFGGLLAGSALGWIGLKRPADNTPLPPTA